MKNIKCIIFFCLLVLVVFSSCERQNVDNVPDDFQISNDTSAFVSENRQSPEDNGENLADESEREYSIDDDSFVAISTLGDNENIELSIGETFKCLTLKDFKVSYSDFQNHLIITEANLVFDGELNLIGEIIIDYNIDSIPGSVRFEPNDLSKKQIPMPTILTQPIQVPVYNNSNKNYDIVTKDFIDKKIIELSNAEDVMTFLHNQYISEEDGMIRFPCSITISDYHSYYTAMMEGGPAHDVGKVVKINSISVG